MRKVSKLFLPAKANFYKLLSDQAEKTLEGVQALLDFMKTGDEQNAVKVREIEEQADLKRRVLLDELDKTFITPFEREDIYNLSKAIDDIIDYGNSTVEEIEIFKIKPTGELIRFAEVIMEVAKCICRAVEYLETNRSISNEYAVKVKSLENQVEMMYRNALADLFELDDIKYVLKMREVYRHLSNCADKADLAADMIGHVVVKIK